MYNTKIYRSPKITRIHSYYIQRDCFALFQEKKYSVQYITFYFCSYYYFCIFYYSILLSTYLICVSLWKNLNIFRKVLLCNSIEASQNFHCHPFTYSSHKNFPKLNSIKYKHKRTVLLLCYTYIGHSASPYAIDVSEVLFIYCSSTTSRCSPFCHILWQR